PDGLPPGPEHARLRRLVDDGVATDAERVRFSELHLSRSEMIFALAEEDLFSIEVEDHPPTLPNDRTQQTVVCACCGEAVMNSRVVVTAEGFRCAPCARPRPQPPQQSSPSSQDAPSSPGTSGSTSSSSTAS
ncbi:MAG TPA: hypothetical protein VM263_00970, partial [Acidimicrobiales bacterium]|nr:hypothetical protein [Acidimicrobiales bacterium]